MNKITIEGYIVKEKTDDGNMFLYSQIPEYIGEEFCCASGDDICFRIDAPIKDFIAVDSPKKCRITVELEP